jgi:hypothetical protein
MVNIPNGGANSVIDRGKEDSIRPEGDRNVSINAVNITLQNCGNGIRAKDNGLHWHMYITGK